MYAAVNAYYKSCYEAFIFCFSIFPFVFFNCLQISEAPARVCVDMEMCMENRFALTIINFDFSLSSSIHGVNNTTPSNATVKFL